MALAAWNRVRVHLTGAGAWQGKAGQGSWKNLYTLTWDLARGLGIRGGREGRGERFPNPFHLQFSFSRHF